MKVKGNQSRKWRKAINLGLFGLSLIPVICYFFLVAHRLTLPFDLEWGEGAGINQIHRIITGGSVYAEPSLEFSALVYSPFYYLISSVGARLLGNMTLAARLVSVLSSISAAALIGSLVWRQTRNGFGAWLAGALYLGCFAISDGFYDLVRVDSLYILILLAGFAALLSARTPLALFGTGMAIALGFFTKQSALLVFLPLFIYLLGTNWKRYWPVLAGAGLGLLVPFWLINAQSEGWFLYYLINLPREHGYSILAALNFWIGDLLGPLGIAFSIGLVPIVFWNRVRGETERDSGAGPKREKNAPRPQPDPVAYLMFVLGAIGAAWITRASNGGGANNLMPAFAGLSILFGLGYSKAVDLVNDLEKYQKETVMLLSCLVAVQFLGLIYNPFTFLPTSSEIRANQILLEEISENQKPVLIPYRSHLPLLLDRESSIHAVNLFELTGYFQGDVLPEGNRIISQIQERICEQAYGLVILDQPIPWFDDQLREAYRLENTRIELERSSLLDWQRGLEAAYYPKEEYDLDACLGTIE